MVGCCTLKEVQNSTTLINETESLAQPVKKNKQAWHREKWEELRNHETVKKTQKYVNDHQSDISTYGLVAIIAYLIYRFFLAKPKTAPIVAPKSDEFVANLTQICAEEEAPPVPSTA